MGLSPLLHSSLLVMPAGKLMEAAMLITTSLSVAMIQVIAACTAALPIVLKDVRMNAAPMNTTALIKMQSAQCASTVLVEASINVIEMKRPSSDRLA